MRQNPSQRLLRTPRPLPNESLPGYFLRLAELNFYDSPVWILEKAGMHLDPQYGRWDSFIELMPHDSRLLEFTGLTDLEFENLHRLEVSRQFICWKVPKICPHCLKEESYSRKEWDIIPFTACPKHRCILINYCPMCESALSWDRSSISHCLCGYDWRYSDIDNIKQIKDESELLVVNRIFSFQQLEDYESRNSTPPLFKLDEYVAAMCNLIDIQLYLATGIGLIDSTDNLFCHRIAVDVSDALNDWPDGFFKFCERFDIEYLQRWYWYRLNMKTKAMQETKGWLMVDGALDEYVKAKISDIAGLRLFIEKEEISNELNISLSQVDQLIKKGLLLSINGFKSPNATLIDARSYKKYRHDLLKSKTTKNAANELSIDLNQFTDIVQQYPLEIPDEIVDQAKKLLQLKQLQTQSTNIRLNPIEEWYAYLDKELENKSKSEDTVKNYIRGFSLLQRWSKKHLEPGKPYTRETIENWIKYMSSEGNNINSINLYLSGVRSFFQFAHQHKYVPIDPTESMPGLRNSYSYKHKRKPLSDSEAQTLLSLESMTLRDKAIIAICLYTGSRQIELWRANIDDIQINKRQVILKIQGKGQREKKDKLVIASKTAQNALKAYLAELDNRGHEHGPLFITERKYKNKWVRISRRTLAYVIKEAFRKAGIIDSTKTAYSMRHSAIGKVLDRTGDIRKAQISARHSSPIAIHIYTTQRYMNNLKSLEDPGEKYIKYGFEDE